MRIRKLLWFVAGLLLVAIPLAATSDALRDDHPERYTVARGDTLWDISERFLTAPWLWPEIWHVNPEIENPHLIYPGDEIRLVYVEGEPRLTVERGRREVRLSPRIREEQLDQAISAIPLSALRPFLNRSLVVDDAFFDEAPYIVAGEDERVMAARNDHVYVRRLPEAEALGGYSVVRRGNAYTDPATGEVLGLEATYVGDASVVREGDPGTARLSASNREILPGDRLLRAPRREASLQVFPRAPDAQVDGHIIDVLDGVSQIGQFDVVVVNLGTEHGMEEGHVMAVFKAGRVVRDQVTREQVTLPEERAGEIILFRTFEKLSFGLVMRASRSMNVMDLVQNP
ncbi:MAG: LysM peptidoglycan-binding domain-containing protein [Aquisalimonadaceae bacterium]